MTQAEKQMSAGEIQTICDAARNEWCEDHGIDVPEAEYRAYTDYRLPGPNGKPIREAIRAGLDQWLMHEAV